jgi:CHAT domain-containing protein
VLQALGQAPKAVAFAEQAVAMTRKLGRQILATASEAEALAFVHAQPRTRDAFLSFTTTRPEANATAYAAVWSTKSAVTRVLEHRHAAARLAGAHHALLLDDLRAARRSVDELLRDAHLPRPERDRLLTQAGDRRDRLERTLAQAVPLLQRAQELDALGPEALLPRLPEHAALIDVVRYTRFAFDPARPGKAGLTRTPWYAAFVLTRRTGGDSPGSDLVRVELGEAGPIDRTVAAWRRALDAKLATAAARELHERVWAKLAPHLPAGTMTLYLAPDGDLARMPWAALPVAGDRVLLEEYALATVPHGPFLLEALLYPRAYRGAESTLLLGGVEYHAATWSPLPGTATEVAALQALAPRPATLTRSDATVQRLTGLLPRVRYAHLATHGFFDAPALVAEQERARRVLESRQLGDATRPVAAQNPLGFVGLVLAEGRVLTGLNLVDLPLEDLKLVTLSACETGLGALTGGEGVQGLQRAFHLAGCNNVVASLWKVDDDATAALMAKFYHDLWVEKKPPIEALRQAQLTIYRHPERIAALARERGPNFANTVKLPAAAAPPGGQRAPTKLWAAFVLSGVGR